MNDLEGASVRRLNVLKSYTITNVRDKNFLKKRIGGIIYDAFKILKTSC